jgi:voltage-gated potassium channel Kch
MTTVGYGDVYPETDTGRAIAILVMVVGIGFLSLLIGAVSERSRKHIDFGLLDLLGDLLAHVAEPRGQRSSGRSLSALQQLEARVQANQPGQH